MKIKNESYQEQLDFLFTVVALCFSFPYIHLHKKFWNWSKFFFMNDVRGGVSCHGKVTGGIVNVFGILKFLKERSHEKKIDIFLCI